MPGHCGEGKEGRCCGCNKEGGNGEYRTGHKSVGNQASRAVLLTFFFSIVLGFLVLQKPLVRVRSMAADNLNLIKQRSSSMIGFCVSEGPMQKEGSCSAALKVCEMDTSCLGMGEGIQLQALCLVCEA